MSHNPSLRSAWSWLDAVTGWFSAEAEKAKPAGRNRLPGRLLQFEPLEHRSLLSVSMPAAISGVAYYDPTGSALTASDTRLSGVTVKLFRDGGNGVFDGGASGGDDTLVASSVTNTSGGYQFTNLSAGTYFVEQLPATGYVLPTGKNVATVTIAASDLQGVTGQSIDTFSTTIQAASAAYPSGTTGTSYSTAPEAVGGGRDLFVQLTSPHGSCLARRRHHHARRCGFLDRTRCGRHGPNHLAGTGHRRFRHRPRQYAERDGIESFRFNQPGRQHGIELSLGADHAGTATLKIYTDGGDWSSATVTIPDTGDGTASQQVFVPFTSFSVGAGTGADFTMWAHPAPGHRTGCHRRPSGGNRRGGTQDFVENFSNVAQADLAIVKTALPSPVVAGQTLTYTLTTTNNGPSAATGVTITDTLPTGVTFVSATPSQGSENFANGVLTVDLGNMADGAAATTTLMVTVGASTTGTITNTASVTGNETDPNPSNNTSTVSHGQHRGRFGHRQERFAESGDSRTTAHLYAHGYQQRALRRHRRDRG